MIVSVVYWGDEATIVYNESYTRLIGRKHPALQGQNPRIEFAEIWNHFEALLEKQRETAETVMEDNAFLLLFRHGFLEETYFSWKFVPIIGDEGWVVGSYATVVEVTREVISDRRLATVRSLSRHLSRSQGIKDLWSRIISGIEGAEKDIPIALLYSVVEKESDSKARWKSPDATDVKVASIMCLLEGSIGIPKDHQLAPSKLDVDSDDAWFGSSIRKAAKDLAPVVTPITDEQRRVFEGIEWRGHGVATHFIVCPIIPTDLNNVLAVLIIPLNPRRTFDNDYSNFFHLLIQQVTIPQLSAVILREEVERRQSLAREEALNRDRLYRDLSDAETKFARFANRAPIGLGILTPEGLALYANDLWRNLTSLEVGSQRVSWDHVLCEGEVGPVNEAWERMINCKKSITITTRLNRPWRAPDPDAEGNVQWTETHILLAMYPDLDEFKEVTTVMSCITDIR
jgi:PAS domain-containing protein